VRKQPLPAFAAVIFIDAINRGDVDRFGALIPEASSRCVSTPALLTTR